jgi:ABC-2 type transport system ATP-binding protein
MGAGVVHVDGVSFRYGSGFILGPLSFTAGTGVTGLMGPNGAGKSTLSRLVCGIARPSSGAVRIDDHLVSSGRRGRATQRLIGYVPQHLTFPRRARVVEVLHHSAWLHEVPAGARPQAVCSALSAVDLADRSTSRCGDLSGGMIRRLAVAQALVHAPRVLFLDEPTTGLDPRQRLVMRDHLSRLAVDHTVLLATHLAEDVQALADRVLVLGSGTQLFHGSLDQLLATTGRAARRGLSPIDAALDALLGPDLRECAP